MRNELGLKYKIASSSPIGQRKCSIILLLFCSFFFSSFLLFSSLVSFRWVQSPAMDSLNLVDFYYPLPWDCVSLRKTQTVSYRFKLQKFLAICRISWNTLRSACKTSSRVFRFHFTWPLQSQRELLINARQTEKKSTVYFSPLDHTPIIHSNTVRSSRVDWF